MSAQRSHIFDAHVHVEDGLEAYDLTTSGKNVIYNDLASYRANADAFRRPGDSVALIIDTGNDFDFVRLEAENRRIDALKIHSRISKLSERDWGVMLDRVRKMPAHLPVIVDTFYFGSELDYQPRLSSIIDLIQGCPQRSFIVAHSGGYRLLEYFFHLRELKNCYYELALSLQYLEDSSVMKDLIKLVRHTDKKRILYGSDFPFASPKRQAQTMLKICEELQLSDGEIEAVMFGNAAALFGKGTARA